MWGVTCGGAKFLGLRARPLCVGFTLSPPRVTSLLWDSALHSVKWAGASFLPLRGVGRIKRANPIKALSVELDLWGNNY